MLDLYRSLTISQFLAALETLEQSVAQCDDVTWSADHIDQSVSQVVVHTLFFTDLYLHSGLEGFKEQEFHLDHPDFFLDFEASEDTESTISYNRQTCTSYLEFCKEKVAKVIESETEADLRGASGFNWQKRSRAELHIYNLRHVQHHAAQLGLRLQLNGGKPLDWVGGTSI